jgi:uncharacterized protein (DUF4415 family)
MKRKRGIGVMQKVPKDRTNWAKLRAMPDSEIKFTKDAPRTSPADWTRAIAHRGIPELMVKLGKTQIALRVDNDVLEWFKAQGPGYRPLAFAAATHFALLAALAEAFRFVPVGDTVEVCRT